MHAEDTSISPPPSTHNPKADRLRQTRREVRRAGSAFLDATELLDGKEYQVAVELVELSEWLLDRLATAERRAA